MGQKIHKKTIFLMAFLGLLSVQVKGQSSTFTTDEDGWTSSFNCTVTQGAEAGTDGVLIVTSGAGGGDTNNNTLDYPGAINADANKYLKITFKNPTNAVQLRMRANQSVGGNTWVTLGTIAASGSEFIDHYVDLTGVATFIGAANTGIDLQFRDGATVVSGGPILVDEISFTAASQLPASLTFTYEEYIGGEAAGATANSTSTLITTQAVGAIPSDGHEEDTAWHFGTVPVEFSNTQAYEGTYSLKVTAADNSTAGAGWFYFTRNAGSHPVPADKTLTDDGVHLAILNVFVESGSPTQLKCKIAQGAPASNVSMNWDLTGLEEGKWHRIVQEIDPDDIVTTMQIGLNLTNTANGIPVVVYIDGIEFLSSTAEEYRSTTGLGVNTSWATVDNWSFTAPATAAEPLATDIIYIKNDINIWHAGEVAKEVFVKNGNSLTFKNSVPSLTTEELHTGASGSVVIEPGSSLIVSGISTGGNITYKRTLTTDALLAKAWHTVSSPITGETVSNFIANNSLAASVANPGNVGIGKYNNSSSPSGWSYYSSTYSGSDSFDGTSYIVRLAAAGDASFTGTYTSGDKDFTISQGTETFYNLVGNPYTAYVTVGDFFTANAATDRLSENTLWIWNPATDNYEQKMAGTDAAFEIAPGQAFFVSSGTAASNKVTFTEANQSHQTDTFLRESRTEVSLKIAQGDLEYKTRVYYIDGTTEDFDNGFDGSLFTAHDYGLAIFTQLVSNNLGKNLGVQSLPNSNLETMIIPVGIKALANEEITFSVEAMQLPTGIKVFLEDRLTNTFTRLDEANTEYKITLTEAIDGVGRFYLYTTQSALSVDDDAQLNSVSIYKTNSSTLKIAGLQQGKASVSLFNIQGKQILTSTFEANGVKEISLPNLATGVYLVQLTTETGKLNKKIILE